jgi:cell wall-associated NlpC family hydrolase
MSFAICIVPSAPLRKEDTHRSEMISQVLFGELAEVLEENKSFTRIRCVYDGYEGWCQSNQMIAIEDTKANTITKRITADWDTIITANNQPMHIPIGSSLGFLENGKAVLDRCNISYAGQSFDPDTAVISVDAIKAKALQYLNTPYLWGGRSVYGIDCSGFVQQVFRCFNIALPRDAYQQAGIGEAVGFLQEAQCGDLAYFDNEEGRITHVGIMLGTDTLIHASGKVRIDKIDNMGIVNGDTGERTHTLRIIKRYF